MTNDIVDLSDLDNDEIVDALNRGGLDVDSIVSSAYIETDDRGHAVYELEFDDRLNIDKTMVYIFYDHDGTIVGKF